MSRRLSPIVVALLLVAPTARAGSIYARANGKSSLYADDKARDVGDVVTIVIQEHSVIENSASRKNQKKTGRSASAAGTFEPKDITFNHIANGKIFEFPKADYESSSDASLDGSTDYGKDRSVTDKITVTVEDVLPNGYLVVLGQRRRKIDGDLQTVQVSGIIRPSDVTFANEVSSEKVGDFHVVYTSQGNENTVLNNGWLGKLLNILNPF